MKVIQLDIYEYEQDMRVLTLSHLFYGRTWKIAEGNAKAHMETDSFFRASMTSGKFKGIRLYTVEDRYEQ